MTVVDEIREILSADSLRMGILYELSHLISFIICNSTSQQQVTSSRLASVLNVGCAKTQKLEVAQMMMGKTCAKAYKAGLGHWHNIFGMVLVHSEAFMKTKQVTQEELDVEREMELTRELESSLMDLC